MLLLRKKPEEETQRSEIFGYTSKYIDDELDLVHDQQENIVRVLEELEKAFSQVEKMKKLMKIIKKIDQTVLKKALGEKRKQESRMINIMEDIKKLVKNQRYEDIDKLMFKVKNESQIKIKLSQEELTRLRGMMNQIAEMYKEASGLCRLYTMIYEHTKQVYEKCEQELSTETTEEKELSTAGSYTEHVRGWDKEVKNRILR